MNKPLMIACGLTAMMSAPLANVRAAAPVKYEPTIDSLKQAGANFKGGCPIGVENHEFEYPGSAQPHMWQTDKTLQSVTMLGSKEKLSFNQDASALQIKLPAGSWT